MHARASERLPRIAFDMLLGLTFLALSRVVLGLVGGTRIPWSGIELLDDAGWLLSFSMLLVASVFLVRGLHDLLVIADDLAGAVARALGLGESRSVGRILRDVTYALLVLVLAAAASPVVGAVPVVGPFLKIAVAVLAIGLIALLSFDAGKTLQAIVEAKSEKLIKRATKR